MIGLLALSCSLAATTVLLGATQDHDETNPRAPGSPLEIVFTPYECTECRKVGLLEDPPEHEFLMTRTPIGKLAEMVGAGKDWMAVESPHFRIFTDFDDANVKFKDSAYLRFDLERLKTIFPDLKIGYDGARLDRHQRLHLYHIRVERLYSHFAALTGSQLPFLGMPERYEIYLFQDYSTHHAYTDRYVGGANDKGGIQHHFRDKPNFIVFTTAVSVIENRDGKSDLTLANHVMHNAAHLVIDGHNNYFRETWAWLEEGLAHYYERKESPRVNNFCWAEGAPPSTFQKPDWDTTIFALVRREKDPNFSMWCEKLQPGELSGVENGLSFSFVRWLVETEPLRFTKLIARIDDTVGKPSCSELIEEAFGCSPTVLHQRWREYVLSPPGR